MSLTCDRVYDSSLYVFFFFNDTATTEIYTLSLHDALPISRQGEGRRGGTPRQREGVGEGREGRGKGRGTRRLSRRRSLRSEEHTSELQSRQYLVCRLLLEKKKKHKSTRYTCPHTLQHKMIY